MSTTAEVSEVLYHLEGLVLEKILTIRHWSPDQIQNTAGEVVDVIATRADVLWSDPDSVDLEVMDAVATGIAVLACRRNGVNVDGRHFCHRRGHNNCWHGAPGWSEFIDDTFDGEGRGVVYTPKWVADRITFDCLAAVVANPGPLQTWTDTDWVLLPSTDLAELRVADIACGSGAFLLSAARFMAGRLVDGMPASFDQDVAIRTALLHVLAKQIYGVDVEPWAVEITRICLALLVPLDDLDTALERNIVIADSLLGLDVEQRWPEVAERGGFDAVIGNPPYLGGQKITGALGKPYRERLVKEIAGGVKGSVDLAAYFALRSFSLLNDRGALGLITTNTLAQGVTREVGLGQIVEQGGVIWQALKSAPWPDKRAALQYCVVWITRAKQTNTSLILKELIPLEYLEPEPAPEVVQLPGPEPEPIPDELGQLSLDLPA